MEERRGGIVGFFSVGPVGSLYINGHAEHSSYIRSRYQTYPLNAKFVSKSPAALNMT